MYGFNLLYQLLSLMDEQTCRADSISVLYGKSPHFLYFMSNEKHGWENVNLLNLTLCKSLPRITHFSSFCKPLLRLKLNSSPNKLGFVKCQLSNHRRLRSIQVLIVSRSCQTHNDDSVSYLPLIKLFHSVGDKR